MDAESEERIKQIEKTTLFLLEHMARFDAQMSRFDEGMNSLRLEVDRVVRVQSGLQDLVEIVFAAQRDTEKRMSELSAGLDRNSRNIDKLTESQKHTDERLNALIRIVDGLIPRS